MQHVDHKDRKYLKLLSIFHWVFGGIAAALSMLPLFYVSIGLSYILRSDELPPSDTGLTYSDLGWLLLIGSLVFFFYALTLSICVIASGRFLAKRKRYEFSFIVACIECTFTPVGLILGIYTIIVLSKKSVKALYGLSS